MTNSNIQGLYVYHTYWMRITEILHRVAYGAVLPIKVIVVSILLIAPAAVFAASIDCKRANTATEHLTSFSHFNWACRSSEGVG